MNKSQLILIAEDSDDDYEATVRAFNQAGNLKNEIVRCENGQEVLDYLRQKDARRPCVILLDLNMPVMDGRSALREIKGDEALKDIPVIVLTTSLDERDVGACYADGANTYIQKPVDLDRFFDAIKRLQEYWCEIAILPKAH